MYLQIFVQILTSPTFAKLFTPSFCVQYSCRYLFVIVCVPLAAFFLNIGDS
jgi:hypothetical protein